MRITLNIIATLCNTHRLTYSENMLLQSVDYQNTKNKSYLSKYSYEISNTNDSLIIQMTILSGELLTT